MRVYSLASGSRGNCTLVMLDGLNILIDVGLSMKQINQKLMISVGIDLEEINYVFISHEHADHVMGFKPIYNKYKHIQFLTNNSVIKFIVEKFNIVDHERIKPLLFETFFGTFSLFPFELNHDVECYGLHVSEHDTEHYTHICDNGGLYDKDLIERLSNSTYYSIESNHFRMWQVMDNKRHEGLKRRVLGFYGHQNNYDAMSLAFKLIGNKTKGIIFNHLSEECNDEQELAEFHEEMIGIWGHKTEFKNIEIQYARQNEVITFES